MSKIKKPSELSVTTLLKALVYGQPGIGKSTLALSMPAPLLIDCDRGVHRVEPQHLSDTVEVDSWEDIDEVLDDKETLKNYQTIIFDTGGKLIDFMTAYILKTEPKLKMGSGQLSLQGYGVRKVMFQALLARIQVMNLHVMFLAHEREEKDGDTRYVRPEIGGSSGGDLIKELDIVGYMEAIGKKRVIRFNPQEKFYAKNALRLPDPMDVPDTEKGNVFMQGILKIYNQHLATRKAQGEAYGDLMELVRQNAEDVKDAKKANEFMEWALELEHIWDSKFQASRLLNARAKELGLVWDSNKKCYKTNAGTEKPE